MPDSSLLDANVLFPIALCDTLIRLSQWRLYRARWTQEILNEVKRNVLDVHPHIVEAAMDKRLAAMNRAVPDAMIEGYDALVGAFPEAGTDAHVIAAALVGQVDEIVTNNTKDFRHPQLARSGISVVTADEFLVGHATARPETMIAILNEQSAAFRKKPMSVEELLKSLGKSAPRFATEMLSQLDRE